jgi:hypothetical protein
MNMEVSFENDLHGVLTRSHVVNRPGVYQDVFDDLQVVHDAR